ncbi:MAG: carbonic anhydrase [Spirochaetia bacterium]|nr:carbonic anhydrase [Spirochaetia bacterium]
MNKTHNIRELLEGFARFTSGTQGHDQRCSAYAKTLHEQQSPKAIIVTCSDSRVPPELLFDAGFGELFVIRTAGNVLSDYDIASIEYAVSALGVHNILVVGHSSCGAIQAAVDDDQHDTYHIRQLKEAIFPVLRGNPHMTEVDELSRAHVLHVIDELKERSPLITDEIQVAGCFYDLEHCTIDMLEIGRDPEAN